MSRFWLSPGQAVDYVLEALELESGQIFVPALPGLRINQMAKMLFPDAKVEYTGLRPGEKLHECLMCSEESYWLQYTRECNMVLSPMYTTPISKKSEQDYTSDNAEQLTREQLLLLLGL